jgi:hypothetical protein
VVTTTAANPSGVTLPTATTGRRISVINRGTNPINVYPASGGAINGLGTNNPISVPVNSQIDVGASSTTQWYSLGSAGGGLDPVERSTTLNPAVAGTLYLCDTSSGGFTITLPTGTSKASIGFADARETFATGNLTITPASGQAIDGQAANETLVLDVSGSWVTLTWNVANSRWVIQSSAPGSSNQAIVQGGNTLGAAMTIGTNDNFGVNIETNGTTKVAVGTAGDVTIGTGSQDAATGVLRIKQSVDTPAGGIIFNSTVAAQNAGIFHNGVSLVLREGGSDSLSINAGAITLDQIHNLTTGNINSGRYTPTLTGTANVASSTSASCCYVRVGNIVTVSGYIRITPTAAANTQTSFRITLPIASNLTAGNDLGGSGSAWRATAATPAALITGDTVNDAANFDYSAQSTSENIIGFNFQYEVK